MRSVLVVVTVMLMLSPISVVLAQTQLPTTNVTAPKPKPRTAAVNRVTSHAPAGSDAGLPEHPDPNSRVRARDWNAPGVLNLEYMTDAQFAAFQAAHPTAVFYGRCYTGQDPDPNIRASFRRIPAWKFCKG